MNFRRFPTDMSALPVDRRHLRRCLVSGWFSETAGSGCNFCTYLAPGLEYSRPSLIITPPVEADPSEWIWKNQDLWESFALENKVFLHFLLSGEEEDTSGTGEGPLEMVRRETHSRTHYVEIPDNLYLMGFGSGARAAQRTAGAHTEEYAGMALFGPFSEKLPEEGGTLTEKGLPEEAGSVPLPVWIIEQGNSAEGRSLTEFWKRRNKSEGERFSRIEAGEAGEKESSPVFCAEEVWLSSRTERRSRDNEEPLGEVRRSRGWDGALSRALLDDVWRFLGRAARHRGPGHKALRRVQDPGAYGLIRRETEIDGCIRIWYEYVPESARNDAEEVPLVVCMHPRGGSAETFVSLSRMNQAAEERGFIVIFPEAGVYRQKPGGLGNVPLWEGELEGRRFDDVKFIRFAVEDVCARERIDRTKIYACGQSSGGMMTCSLAVRAPELFAAVSPWSGTGNIGFGVAPPETISPKVPFFFMMGDRDVLCSDPENGEYEFRVSSSAAVFLAGVMKAYGLEERKAMMYRSGEISFFVYPDKRGIPMLTVGVVKNMPHGNYPRQSRLAYDEFFCKWSKKDGILYYMGMPV